MKSLYRYPRPAGHVTPGPALRRPSDTHQLGQINGELIGAKLYFEG